MHAVLHCHYCRCFPLHSSRCSPLCSPRTAFQTPFPLMLLCHCRTRRPHRPHGASAAVVLPSEPSAASHARLSQATGPRAAHDAKARYPAAAPSGVMDLEVGKYNCVGGWGDQTMSRWWAIGLYCMLESSPTLDWMDAGSSCSAACKARNLGEQPRRERVYDCFSA